MATAADDACNGWDNSACVGTPSCPPRCPRYVDQAGTAYVIRPYEPADRLPLVAMYESLDSTSRTMGLPPSSRAAIEDWLDGLVDRGWNLVAREGERVVGHVGVAPAGAADPQFVIFVHDDRQNRGLGTELVQQTVAYAADRDYDALTLSVSTGNRRAINVYRNVGFEPAEAGAGSVGGAIDLEMRLPLDGTVAEQVRLPPAER